ncbi:hypothetical protein GCM10023170_094710 [Phytohabitans houttuyneae]|uniref:Uncharacterized protein n=1 Tax=Phytohabitans houttuyneae TaxID=1076126 RepID=A0A6V8K9F1_9ACTN|nr:hypothetical protein Phou_015450 [Phytohabitans houttuyneae]
MLGLDSESTEQAGRCAGQLLEYFERRLAYGAPTVELSPRKPDGASSGTNEVSEPSPGVT